MIAPTYPREHSHARLCGDINKDRLRERYILDYAEDMDNLQWNRMEGKNKGRESSVKKPPSSFVATHKWLLVAIGFMVVAAVVTATVGNHIIASTYVPLADDVFYPAP